MPASIAGLCNTMLYGLVTNGNWMLSAVCMILVIMITLTYYSIMFSYIDTVTISLLSNTIIFITIALYKIEKKDKMEFLAYKQIMQMNEELKSILMNLPEGIVLIDEETNKVSLNN
jgi:c-di-AMP phosphodiesterase-like protein